MAAKLFVLCALLALAASNDLYSGYKDGNQRLIFSQTFDYKPSVFVRSENINVDTFGEEDISNIEIVDNRELKDGVARIESGGAGEKSVSISLKGPAIFRGMNFTVNIYAISRGRRDNSYSSQPGRRIESDYRRFKEDYEVKGAQDDSELNKYRGTSGVVVADVRAATNVGYNESRNDYGVKGIYENQQEDTYYNTKH